MLHSRRPNILLILSDDHGYGDVSMHRGADIFTPCIDRLAAGGVRFSQLYANSSVCSPSRAALMTGRFPDRVGVPGVIRTDRSDSWGYFDPGAVTLPDQLGQAGYETIHIGKWHLGLEEENHPCKRGFDIFRGFLGDMMDDYYDHRRCGNNYMRDGFEEIDPPGHATDLFTDWAVKEIGCRAHSDPPWFMYLAYNAPHTPIQPPDEWLERVKLRQPGLSEQRAKYVALVEHLDFSIGRVLDCLEETAQMHQTLVIYASDNGGQENVGADNGPFRGQKGQMYEGGIRVPGCLSWPSGLEPGRVNDDVITLMDFFPTLCEAAGVPVNHEIDGISVLPALTGEGTLPAVRPLYWVRREGTSRFLGLCQHAARSGDLKILHNGAFEPLELFDLGADPYETTDISEVKAGEMKELGRLLKSHIQSAGGMPWQKPARMVERPLGKAASTGSDLARFVRH